MDYKNRRWQRRGNMKQSKSFKLLLSIALTLMLVCSSWAQSTAVRRIGVLTPGGDFAPVLEGLRQGLAQLGYLEGKQITFIIEDTKMETLDPVKAAMRLLEAKPDLLVTVATSHATAAKQVAGNIPVVFTVLTDPVQSGFVASYASSKNNFTGVSNSVAPLSGKRLEVLKEMVPGIKRGLAVVAIKETIAQKSFQFLAESASKLGIQLVRRDVTTKEELEKILLDTPKGSVDAIIHVPAILLRNHIALLVDKANKDKLPFGVHTEELVKKGALVSYGEDNRLIGIQAARLVVKVLKGVPPSDIPIETPEQPILVVNRTTAKTIGLRIPREFLEHADRIVE
jgi:putative ABC transport system substrate-binding protein